jgi:hypothetical protein
MSADAMGITQTKMGIYKIIIAFVELFSSSQPQFRTRLRAGRSLY